MICTGPHLPCRAVEPSLRLPVASPPPGSPVHLLSLPPFFLSLSVSYLMSHLKNYLLNDESNRFIIEIWKVQQSRGRNSPRPTPWTSVCGCRKPLGLPVPGSKEAGLCQLPGGSALACLPLHLASACSGPSFGWMLDHFSY